MPATEAPAGQDFPLPKVVIWVLCFLLTPLCGSILYYVWRDKHLDAANYANKVSWLSWIVWIGGYLLSGRATGR